MAVKKKETKVDTPKDMEVVEDVVQNEETVIKETAEVNSGEKAEVNEETTVTEDTDKTTGDESGETTVTVDTSVATEEAPQSGKMVKIKPNCNHRFFYGTKWYVLCEGVVMTVPLEVKERLQDAGKLSAL